MEGLSLKEQMQSGTSFASPIEGLRLAENFVKKFYLDDLKRYEVTKASRGVREMSTEHNIKMFRISGLVFNKDEKVQDRLNNVYSSMHGLNLSVLFMIVSDGADIDFYIGTKTLTEDFTMNEELANAFEKSFRGNFPGSDLASVPIAECNKILENIVPSSGDNAVTALTSLPSLKDDEALNAQYVQGIEKFIDTMQGERYTVLIISDPVSGGQIERMKQGYEELYTELSPLSGYDLTVGENQGISLSQTEMEGYTDTIGRSVSKTQSFTKGINITKSESTTNTFGIGVGAMGNLGSMSQTSTNRARNIFSTFGRTVVGGPVGAAVVSGLSQAIGASLGLNYSKAKQTGTSTGENQSEQIGTQEAEQNSHAEMKQQSVQKGINTGSTTSTMVKYENKSIKVFLECVEEHLERLKECENYGMWSSAAYFISPSRETSVIAAGAYKGIINGEGTSLEAASMNTWYKGDSTIAVNEYLRHFTHPRFHDPDYLVDLKAIPDVTPSTMLSTKELSIQCSVPYKSIPGVAVREMAGFGRNVFDTASAESKVRLGSIYHMGKAFDNHEVGFDADRLREHTFVTGSTGSGKSNTVYQMVSGLNRLFVPALIIEPSKGEYKQVFGDKFHVYGTNPALTELLRINPFKFEDTIHVLEHIDRLIDIFNVCWPMYAAMPAVLKEAVEDAYTAAGWNLNTSENRSGYKVYPGFKDLLQSLRRVIKGSDYSQEVKDNYTGSLITRVKSLTNGLNGQIFTSNEIDSKKLFEESTVIDLSRVGSSETKAMIMGIIIMRLQERRISQGGINLPLKHVTVVEEAHNLLKRTSTEQSSETSNLLGKSVEMIANAIAEMRTYGEGFVIVDQAPSLLDLSVIRNTNTKIIMHLPDISDRELVGKAAGLTDDQIVELAKIPSGVAAVYQNKWVEPVLCKIDYYPVTPKEYIYRSDSDLDEYQNQEYIKGRIVQFLVSKLSNEEPLADIEKIKKWLIDSDMESALKTEVMMLLNPDKAVKRDTIEKIVTRLADNANTAFESAKNVDNIDEWNAALLKAMEINTEGLSKNSIQYILECLIHQRSLEREADEENYLKWMNFMGRTVI